VFKLWKPELEEGDVETEVRRKVLTVGASGHYCYAVVEKPGQPNEVYSWGMGECYVLGNAKDDSEFYPYLLKPKNDQLKIFEGKHVVEVVCGTQHCAALTVDSPDCKVPSLDFVQAPAAVAKNTQQPKTQPEAVEKLNGQPELK